MREIAVDEPRGLAWHRWFGRPVGTVRKEIDDAAVTGLLLGGEEDPRKEVKGLRRICCARRAIREKNISKCEIICCYDMDSQLEDVSIASNAHAIARACGIDGAA